MSLLPPSLSTPAPAQTGTASSASSTAPSRGNESSQDGAESFGGVLSRSLAASGESSAKPGGKPAASVPVKRTADEKKNDTPEPVNTAALLFVPLETRIAQAAGANGDTATAAGGRASPALAATSSAEPPANAAAPTTQAAAATVNHTNLAEDGGTHASQALFESGLPAAAAKDRDLASAPAALAPTGDEVAIALPAGKVSDAAYNGQAEQFAGRDERPGDETRDVPGTGRRTDQKPGAAKTAVTASNDAADKAAGSAPLSAPTTTAQHSEVEVPAADSSPTISTVSAAVHANAAASSPAASVAPSQAALTPEVGSGEWGKALGQQMVHMGKAGEHVAELQLNPPELGPLKVTLSMNDNQVQALFVSTHSSVRAAVEAALPQLRITLADNGISLGNTSVSSGGQQQPAFAQNQNGQPSPGGRQGYPQADAAPTAMAPPPRRGINIGVDTYA